MLAVNKDGWSELLILYSTNLRNSIRNSISPVKNICHIEIPYQIHANLIMKINGANDMAELEKIGAMRMCLVFGKLSDFYHSNNLRK